MIAPDYSRAIEQLRYLIEHDFADRVGRSHHFAGGVFVTQSNHWWQHASRREDIAGLRSYIAAVKVLKARANHDAVNAPGFGKCPAYPTPKGTDQ